MIATGTVKAQLVQMEVLPGRPRDNTANMLRLVAAAREEGAELVVFPEMAIPGWPISCASARTAAERSATRRADW